VVAGCGMLKRRRSPCSCRRQGDGYCHLLQPAPWWPSRGVGEERQKTNKSPEQSCGGSARKNRSETPPEGPLYVVPAPTL